jgi:hypothetical protein
MKKVILAVVLLAGCVATPGQDANVTELDRKSREIATRAKLCISAAMKHGGEETEIPYGSGSPAKSQTRLGQKDRDREISKCKATEVQEKEQLSLQEQKEYLREAEQEHSSNTLMMILTTSRPH